jgi:biotin carboxyl carrier protein
MKVSNLVAVAMLAVSGAAFAQEGPGQTHDTTAPGPADTSDLLRRMRQRRALQSSPTSEPAAEPAPPGASFLPPLMPIGNDAAAKKAAPVFTGADPAAIEPGDRIITQIIPLQYAEAVRLRNDLVPLVSADADLTAAAGPNCIIVTDTATRVRRLVELAVALDAAAARQVVAGRPGGPTMRGQVGASSGMVVARAGLPAGTFAAVVTAPTADVLAPADRAVARVRAVPGQAVKAGDVLFELDGAAEAAAVRLAEAHLAVAQARAAAAPAADRAVAQAEVAAAAADVDVRRQALAALTLAAPFDGQLTAVDVQSGQGVRAGTALTQVVGRADWGVRLNVSADAAKTLASDRPLQFVSPGAEPQAIDVVYVSPLLDLATNTVEVRARFTAAHAGLKVGAAGVVRPTP